MVLRNVLAALRKRLAILQEEADFQGRRAAVLGVYLASASGIQYRKAQREIRDMAKEIAEDRRAA
jgi:hypothetical protein